MNRWFRCHILRQHEWMRIPTSDAIMSWGHHRPTAWCQHCPKVKR